MVGAGAAGLFAAIHAGRTLRAAGSNATVLALDGARTLGAKILVAGGGRCNVTHDVVDDTAYAGSTRPAIRKVLRRFGVAETIDFFRALGVELKREETGKLFPTTDAARTVLDALLRALGEAGCVLRHPARVAGVARRDDGRFAIDGAWGTTVAERLVLATGGMALPKTGSDGAGYAIARGLGHTTTERIAPALVPLCLADGHPLRELSGISFDAVVRLSTEHGRTLVQFEGPVLCTHFGLSGPAILDVSRFWSEERLRDPQAHLRLSFLPGSTPESLDADLLDSNASTIAAWFRGRLPERLARTLCAIADVDPHAQPRQLARAKRKALAAVVAACPIHPIGDRGFVHAEVTAGGVPLSEVHLETMESRRTPGLHLVGEILDVDGRIGGYNFQWAWASGFVAGCAAARAVCDGPAGR